MTEALPLDPCLVGGLPLTLLLTRKIHCVRVGKSDEKDGEASTSSRAVRMDKDKNGSIVKKLQEHLTSSNICKVGIGLCLTSRN